MSLLGQDEDEKDTRLDDLMETLKGIKEKQDREVSIIMYLFHILFHSQALTRPIEMADCLYCAVNIYLTKLEITCMWCLFPRSCDEGEKEKGSEWISGSRNTNEFAPLGHQ